jgi:hypothetical protein
MPVTAHRSPQAVEAHLTRTERPYVRILILVLMAVVAALAAYLTMAQRMADPDQFWHIATGRWIVQNGTIPTHDVFSWWATANNREWVAQEWLFGILVYGAYLLGGFTAVYWFASILEGMTVFVVYALVRARKVDPLWALLVTIASMFGTIFFTAARPQMMTFVLIPLTALLLEKGKWPWALAVVLLGVNVHGGVWPLYVLVFAFYEFPRRWWLIGLAAVVAVATPNPVGTFLYPFKAMLNPRTASINEFMPMVLWNYKGDLAMMIAVILLTRRRRIPWKDGLFAIAFVLLSLSAIRHLQWFYLIVLPVLAPYLSLAAIDLSWLRLPQWLRNRLPARLRSLIGPRDDAASTQNAASEATLTPVASVSAAPSPAPPGPEATPGEDEVPSLTLGRSGLRTLEYALVATLVVATFFLSGAVSRQPLDVDRWYPKDMIAYLKLYKAKRIFNIWHEGGYLILNGIRPLIDGRGDPYTAQAPGQKDLLSEYMDTADLKRDPMQLFDELKVDYVLVMQSPLLTVLLLEPRLQLVKTDDYHGLFKLLPKPSSTTSASAESTETTVSPPGQWLRDAAKNARPTLP